MLLASGEQREDYSEVEIRVFAPDTPGGNYSAELSVPGGVGSARMPWVVNRAALVAAAADPDAYGRALGASLFGDDVLGQTYAEAVAAIRAGNRGLRVRLRLDAPELHDIRWERLYQPIEQTWKPIALTGATPFSRWLPPTGWQRPLPITERPIRVLVLAASPAGLEAAGLDPIDPGELEALHNLFGALPETQATFLESGTSSPATLDQLRAALPTGFHVVHVLCHGAVAPNGSVLYLDGTDGKVEAVSAGRIVAAFGAATKPPLLCFLGACESAARGRADAFVPIGPALVQEGGLQAAIAMSDRVGQTTARMFTEQFYKRLLVHGMVDLATNEARALVNDRWDWGVPVLFSRLDDNQLIDFPEGNISAGYLEHAGSTVGVLTEAVHAAESGRSGPRDRAMKLIDDINELIRELSKSNRLLVDYASSFREVPNAPELFGPAFAAFYLNFKRRYDAEDWVDADTSCGKIQVLATRLLPELAGILGPAEYAQLQHELGILGNADDNLLLFLREYLDAMDHAVERIKELLDSGKTDEAIAAKREFEARISPSFRRTKELLSKMTRSSRQVAA